MKNYLIISIVFFISFLFSSSKAFNQTFTKQFVDQDFSGICTVKVCDSDMDGDYDIMGGSEHKPNSAKH